MKVIKYTENRRYKDFVDEETQETLVKNLRKTKKTSTSFFKKLINKFIKK